MSAYRTANATAPAHEAFVVSTSDSTLLPCTRSLYIGGAGNVAVYMAGGENPSSVIFYSVAAGTILPIQVTKVLSTGTTATNILALY